MAPPSSPFGSASEPAAGPDMVWAGEVSALQELPMLELWLQPGGAIRL